MRQRYLLGKYNYERYGEALGGEELMHPNGKLDILSTDYYRTMQSGYSEIAGLY